VSEVLWPSCDVYVLQATMSLAVRASIPATFSQHHPPSLKTEFTYLLIG